MVIVSEKVHSLIRKGDDVFSCWQVGDLRRCITGGPFDRNSTILIHPGHNGTAGRVTKTEDICLGDNARQRTTKGLDGVEFTLVHPLASVTVALICAWNKSGDRICRLACRPEDRVSGDPPDGD